MMKKLIIFLVIILALPSVALAANDVTFPQQTNILMTDGTTYNIDDNSTFDSFVVNGTTIVFTLSASSLIIVYSTDQHDFTLTGTNESFMTITEECTSNQSVTSISVSADATTTYNVTFTPNDTCGTVASPSSTGGGGGGGGGGGTTPATTTTPASTLANLNSQSSGGGSVTLAAPVSSTVSSGGGSVTLADNSASISFASGSVSSDSTVNLTPQLNYAQPDAGYAAVGSQAYNITAISVTGGAITQLSNDSTLTFNYTESQISGIIENSLKVSYWAEETGEWIDLPTTIDHDNNTVTATVSHLTKFIIQGQSSTAPAGSLIKTAESTAVYYLGHDEKRYVFPDDKVYYTWYENFSDVITVSSNEMTSYSLGGNITIRPGTELVQFVAYDYSGNMIVDDPHIYAVEPGGTIHWLETAEIASALYGSAWEQNIVPVINYLMGNYVTGDSVAEPLYPTGSVVKETSSNNLYYIDESSKRLVTTNGNTSNAFQSKYNLSTTSLADYTIGLNLSDYQNSISWTSGK